MLDRAIATLRLVGVPRPARRVHEYTFQLSGAVPKPDPRLRAPRVALEGEVADIANPLTGCYFHPRCRFATGVCRTQAPALREIALDHAIRCHRTEKIALHGASEDFVEPARGRGLPLDGTSSTL